MKPQDIKFTDAIGQDLICEDGVKRPVKEIVEKYADSHFYLINEQDPDSRMGYEIHALSLITQLMGWGPACQADRVLYENEAKDLKMIKPSKITGTRSRFEVDWDE